MAKTTKGSMKYKFSILNINFIGNNKIRTKKEKAKVNILERITRWYAYLSYLGSIIAISYLPVDIMAKRPEIDINSEYLPKVSGVYNLDIIGLNRNGITWARVVPNIRVKTFLVNSFFKSNFFII